MKKITTILLSLIMIVSMTGCSALDCLIPSFLKDKNNETNIEEKQEEIVKDTELEQEKIDLSHVEVNLKTDSNAQSLFKKVISESKDGSQIVLRKGNDGIMINGFSFYNSSSYVNYPTFVLGTTIEKENAEIFNCEGFKNLLIYSSSMTTSRTITAFNPETGETKEFVSPASSELQNNEKLLKLREMGVDSTKFEGILVFANNIGTVIDISGWNQIGFYATDEGNATLITCAALTNTLDFSEDIINPKPETPSEEKDNQDKEFGNGEENPSEEPNVEIEKNPFNLFDNVVTESKDDAQKVIPVGGVTEEGDNYSSTLSSNTNYTTFILGASTDKTTATIFNCKEYNELTITLYSIMGNRKIFAFNPETDEVVEITSPSMYEIMNDEKISETLMSSDEENKIEFNTMKELTKESGIKIDISEWNQIGFYAENESDYTFFIYAGLS